MRSMNGFYREQKKVAVSPKLKARETSPTALLCGLRHTSVFLAWSDQCTSPTTPHTPPNELR